MAWNATRTATFYDKEILKYPKGFEAVRNAVIDATQVVATGDGRYIVEAGTVMVLVGGTNEQQTVTINATGGSFKVIVGQSATDAIAWNAAIGAVQTALEDLDTVNRGDITVTGTPSNYTLVYGGRFAHSDRPAVTTDPALLTGGTGAAAVGTTVPGVAGGPKVKPAPASGVVAGDVQGILAYTVELFGITDAKFDEPAALFFDSCIFDKNQLLSYSGNSDAVKAALPTCSFE